MSPARLLLLCLLLSLCSWSLCANLVDLSLPGAGLSPDGRSYHPVVSADGRWVAFESDASNLVPGDTNGSRDIFLYEVATAHLSRVSVTSTGAEHAWDGYNGKSQWPSISADGRYVTFTSAADLVEGIANQSDQVFRHDRITGQTTLVSADNAGHFLPSYQWYSTISGNGRYVAFVSWSPLSASEDGSYAQILVRDCVSGRTFRASSSLSGGRADNHCDCPQISADGRYVVFTSAASNLIPGDDSESTDVFIRDRVAGTLARVSPALTGAPDQKCKFPSLSADGRTVLFEMNYPVMNGLHHGADVFIWTRGSSARVLNPDVYPGEEQLYSHPVISADARTALYCVYSYTQPARGRVTIRQDLGGTTRELAPGRQAELDSSYPHCMSLSGDGRLAACLLPVGGAARSDAFLVDSAAAGFRSMLSAVVPANGSVNVSRSIKLVLSFRWDVDQASVAPRLSVRSSTGKLVPGTLRWLIANRRLVFTPRQPLLACTSYRLTLASGIGRAGSTPITWSESYMFTTGASLSDARAGALTVAATAAGTGRGAQLTLSLSAPATVLVRVINLAGREVALLPATPCGAGVGVLRWDGRGKTGTAVPTGCYLAEVLAVTVTGESASCLVPLQQ